MSIRRHPQPGRAAIAMVLSAGFLSAGHLSAAPSQEESEAAGREGASHATPGQTQEEATRIVRSVTDKVLAQFPHIPPEKQLAIQAASQQFRSDVDKAVANYAAAVREIVSPSKVESMQPARSPSGSDPWVPDGKVVANSVSDRCEGSASAAPHDASPTTGRSVLCVCVDQKGALTQDPVIAESSGDSRVDSGAVKLARLDSGRYKPPAVDGRPQKGCFRFAVNFRHSE